MNRASVQRLQRGCERGTGIILRHDNGSNASMGELYLDLDQLSRHRKEGRRGQVSAALACSAVPRRISSLAIGMHSHGVDCSSSRREEWEGGNAANWEALEPVLVLGLKVLSLGGFIGTASSFHQHKPPLQPPQRCMAPAWRNEARPPRYPPSLPHLNRGGQTAFPAARDAAESVARGRPCICHKAL